MPEHVLYTPTAAQRWIVAKRLPIQGAFVLLLVVVVANVIYGVTIGRAFDWTPVVLLSLVNVFVAFVFHVAKQRQNAWDRRDSDRNTQR